MPGMDTPELNAGQRDELKALLARREEELQQSIARLRESLAAPGGRSGPEVRDSVDDGDARAATSVDLVQLQRQEEELREVRHAHDRLRSGDYGRCEACDEPIPFERLKLRPSARFCVRHEEAWEKAHPGTAVAT
jgi:DnaK suppressor protein